MDDRIRLAEAMGYRTTRQTEEWHGPTWEGRTPEGESTWRLPDPFTDANDDYAVLEWMIARCKLGSVANAEIPDWEQWDAFCCNVPLSPEERLIGDYARAALKVLERDDEY